MCDVYHLLGLHKINTTGYHTHTDRLVERFNRTLTDMLVKTVEKGDKDWYLHLPFILFAYRSSLQVSTQESPFFLLYGRDPQLPTSVLNDPPTEREELDVDNYESHLSIFMDEAWEIARANVQQTQKRQKRPMIVMPDHEYSNQERECLCLCLVLSPTSLRGPFTGRFK